MLLKMNLFRVEILVFLIWMSCLQDGTGSPNPSLWGERVKLMGEQCEWRLPDQTRLPDLKEFSVCMKIQRLIVTSHWTAFDYKQWGRSTRELGLGGSGKDLDVWIFGKEMHVGLPEPLSLHQWHRVCLTWSSQSKHLRLYINESQLGEFPVNGSRLAGNGTLTLGVSHTLVDGKFLYETGKELMGHMTLFRMWGRVLAPHELSGMRCVEGDVIGWSRRDWQSFKCDISSDSNLTCEWQMYEIKMTISVNPPGHDEGTLKKDVHEWLEHTFHSNVSIHDVVILSSRLGLWRGDSLEQMRTLGKKSSSKASSHDFRVYLEVTPKEDVFAVQKKLRQQLTNPYHHDGKKFQAVEDSIAITSVGVFPNVTGPTPTTDHPTPPTVPTTAGQPLCTSVATVPSSVQVDACSPDHSEGFRQDTFYRVHLNVSINGTVDDPEHLLRRWLNATLGPLQMTVLNFELKSDEPKYGCTFQVMADSLNVTETSRLIKEQLTQIHTVGGAICLQVLPGNIHIVNLAPGSCMEELQSTPYGQFAWPKYEPQNTAILLCEKNHEDTATRFCRLDGLTDEAVWDPPVVSSCQKIVVDITDLDKVNVTANNSAAVVEIIGSLVNGQEGLSESDVSTLIGKLEEVVAVGPIQTNLGENIIHVISDLLHSRANLTFFTNEILGLTDGLGSRMEFRGEMVEMTVPSLALQLVHVNASHFLGLTFGVSSVSSNLTPETFVKKTFVETPMAEALASISLPPVLEDFFPQRNSSRTPRVQFQFLQAHQLFQRPSGNMALGTDVVSAGVSDVNVSDLHRPIIITLRHLKKLQTKHKRKCVYWDFSLPGGGGWAENGCHIQSTDDSQTTCYCYHLTHFGVLLDVSKADLSDQHVQLLTIISYVGCGLSSIFLGITLITYLAFEKLRQDYPSKILINLSVALLGLNMVFLLNSWLATLGSAGLCVGVAVVQHFFLLASFMWMGLEALHMYFALVKVFNVYVPSYILKFCVVGWGAPIGIVVLVLAIDVDIYGNLGEEDLQNPLKDTSPFCWVRNRTAFYVSVATFILLMLLCNSAVFAVVLVQIRRMRANKATAGATGGVLHDLRVVASLTFLLGLTWILPFFAWEPLATIFTYLFAILNTLQGFFIFIFHCLMKENVVKQWRIHLCCGPLRPGDYSEWSHSLTGQRGRNRLVRSLSIKSEDTSSMRKISDSSTSAVSQITT